MVDARDLDEPLLTLASDSAPLVYAWNLADGDECTASRITDDDDQMMKYTSYSNLRFESHIVVYVTWAREVFFSSFFWSQSMEVDTRGRDAC